MTTAPQLAPVNQLVSVVVPNTDVVLVVEARNVERIAGTEERPLVFIRGIPRAFLWATKENVVR